MSNTQEAGDRQRAGQVQALAELIVSPTGVNVQPGQIVGITAEPGQEDIWRAVAEAAYVRGAKFVDPWIFDVHVKHSRLLHADADTLTYRPPWLGERYRTMGELHAAQIRLTGPVAPHILDDIDSTRAGHDVLPRVPESQEMIHKDLWNWCVTPGPSAGWASLVYPDLPEAEALARLWDSVSHVMRLDEPEPERAWDERFSQLNAVAKRLNNLRFDALHFSGPGTDLTIGLLPSSEWVAAGSENVDGVKYTSNLPTEEVFTAPDPRRVDGHVRSTKPLQVSGGFVSGLEVRFEQGVAVNATATEGEGLLRTLIAKDEGAARLGEVALVDRESRIGALDTVFYETLLDENSASHIALGAAYPDTVGTDADRERINISEVHTDFMIGSNDVAVTGVHADGTQVPLLRDGNWQFDL